MRGKIKMICERSPNYKGRDPGPMICQNTECGHYKDHVWEPDCSIVICYEFRWNKDGLLIREAVLSSCKETCSGDYDLVNYL
jgi:hypothetical protein